MLAQLNQGLIYRLMLDSTIYQNWTNAKHVCVIGSGTMGTGIAAHLANIGFEVTLLGISNEAVEEALQRAKQQRPPHFYVPETADRIRVGNTQDNLFWAAEADWVCEAIVEKMDAKRILFSQLDSILPPTTAITTNTSGLQISLLAEGLSESFRKRFMGTHFFNPPRYLKLLELIPTEETDPLAIGAMTSFLEEKVARRVVLAKDTPGFIANRFGMWAMFHAVHTTEMLHLGVEQVDAITGPFLGRPKSASFRLNDIVGLDIMRDIAANLYERCPEDPFRANLQIPRSTQTLLSRGWIGDKAGQGYYRKEGRELMAFDFTTDAYRQKTGFSFASLDGLAKLPLGERIGAALELRDEAGEFLRNHLSPVLKYADYLKEEISHNVLDFDRVMMWGFGWEKGPFAMIDAIGADKLGIEAEPFYTDGSIRSYAGGLTALPEELEYRRLVDYPIIESYETFNLRDLGDGVCAACLTTKMGTITPALVAELSEFLDKPGNEPLILTSESRNFSVGYNLQFFMEAIEKQDTAAIDMGLKVLQDLGLKLSTKRIIAAVYGYCLGAGLELAMNCAQIVASAESQIGLPESKVGLIPGGGGTALMRLRSQDGGAKTLTDTAIRLALGQVSTSADDARVLGYLRVGDLTVYHPDRLLVEAKKAALTVQAKPRHDWVPAVGPLAGMIDRAQEQRKQRGEMTGYDETVGDKIKNIFSKSSSYEEALEKERVHFLELCAHALTHARIKHMLETGKPLRN